MSTHSVSQANQGYWEGRAADYDAEPWVKQFIKLIMEEVVNRLEWLGLGKDRQEKGIKVLDYACGPGIVSLALKPNFTRTLGIDLSPAMAAEFNTRVKAQGFSPEEMFAVQGNLLVKDDAYADINPVLKDPEWFDFDAVIVSAGYHHFEDSDLAAKRLVERLKPGTGVFIVVDLLEHGGWKAAHEHDTKDAHGHLNSHGHHGYHHGHAETGFEGGGRGGSTSDVYPTIAHHGFSVERIAACFESAGCVDIGVQVLDEPLKFGNGAQQTELKVFIAKGTRPAHS